MNRRPLILGASALAIAAAVGVRMQMSRPTVHANASSIQGLIAREFGEDVSLTDEARRFADAAASYGDADFPEDRVVMAFLRTTNVVRALETGEALVFVGFESPLAAPCQNTLSASWL